MARVEPLPVPDYYAGMDVEIAIDVAWLAVDPGTRCHFTHARVRCDAPAVAKVFRVRQWFRYCAVHAAGYGRWVEDRLVWHWRPKRRVAQPPTRLQ